MTTHPETKYKYRDRIRIIHDILDSIRNTRDCNISRICRNTNLSHNTTTERIEQLIQAGMILQINGVRRFNNRGGRESRTFFLTETGQKFHDKLIDIYHELEKGRIDIV